MFALHFNARLIRYVTDLEISRGCVAEGETDLEESEFSPFFVRLRYVLLL